MAIGDRVKELRLRKNQSLQQVADAIGGSKAHIWDIEAHRSKNPSLDLLQKLASHFGTTVSYLIGEPEANLDRAAQFFRKNGPKFEAMNDQNLEVIENLLDMIVSKKGDGSPD